MQTKVIFININGVHYIYIYIKWEILSCSHAAVNENSFCFLSYFVTLLLSREVIRSNLRIGLQQVPIIGWCKRMKKKKHFCRSIQQLDLFSTFV